MGLEAVLTRRSDRGGVAMELAVTIPTLILVLLAVLEVVVIARTQLELVAAAREGARVAATVADPARAVTAVENALAPVLSDRVRVTVTRPAVVGRAATVVVSLRHRMVTPLLRWLEVDLRGRAVMRVER
ncbi:MAG TPA: TadE/TadG family type IV pilus assembly protein [Acidimicrobiia bacterium]|nr:TadE/TadG family type IV pilus assembly protein [Acidimicrobiia bacterium]